MITELERKQIAVEEWPAVRRSMRERIDMNIASIAALEEENKRVQLRIEAMDEIERRLTDLAHE